MITDIFKTIINKTSSLDEAINSFNDMMEADSELRADYKDWCLDMGFKTKHGFREYYSEYISLKEINIQSMFESNEEFYDYLIYSIQ